MSDRLDETRVAGIARRFGVAGDEIRPLPAGEANHTWLIGADLVLRIPRDGGKLADDLRKEREMIPIARAAGVSTPEIVAFEEFAPEVGLPVMILRRVIGIDLERVVLPEELAVPVYRTVGRQVARLHAATAVGRGFDAPVIIPRDDGGDDPSSLLAPLVEIGSVDRETADWLSGWFDRLAPFIPESPPAVLIHGDVAPRNLLVDPDTGSFRAVIDWGDAALADPAMDFAKLPLATLPAALEGYLGHDDWNGDELRGWQARAFRYQLHWAVAALGRRDSLSGKLLRPGPAMARLMVILRFLITSRDARWHWLG